MSREHILAVARWGRQAAEALHAAHQFGIIHRDVKPSNLLLDNQCKVWVTDFGLARCRENNSLTQTGDVLGTMRYMNPEQASGDGRILDHRTDVYSLGITLFELATHTHPADGVDDVGVFVQRIRSGQKSPRAVNAAIPRDFDTIIQKATRETPEERYATAQELADDLNRFLEGKPILASRPSLWSRAPKWARRHRAAVYIAISVATAALLGLAASVVQINQALRQEAAERQIAERRFNDLFQRADQFFAIGDQLGPIPAAAGVRRQIYDLSLDYYKQLAAEAAGDGSLDAAVAIAQSRIGAFTAKVGNNEEAATAYVGAIARLDELVAGEPDNPMYAHSLALCRNNYGLLLSDLGRPADAIAQFVEAESDLRRLARAQPANVRVAADLAATIGNHALALKGQRDEAGAYQRFQEAIAMQRTLCAAAGDDENSARALAGSLNNLASVQQSSSPAAAAASYQEAIAIQLKLVADHPFDQVHQSDLARSYNNLGSCYAASKQWARSEDCYGNAIKLQQNIVKASRQSPYYCREMAVSYNNMGTLQSALGRHVDARGSFEAAVELLDRSLALQPDHSTTASDLGGVYNNLAMCLDVMRLRMEAGETYVKAIAMQREALSRYPSSAAVKAMLDKHYVNYARNLASQRKYGEAAQVAVQRAALWPAGAAHLRGIADELLSLAHLADKAGDRAGREILCTAAVEALGKALRAGLPPVELGSDSLASLLNRPDFQDLMARSR